MGLAYLVGYFAVMIIFLIIAILNSHHACAWVFYGIAAVLQLLSLLGGQRKYAAWGMSYVMIREWLIYAALLIVSAVIISIRRRKEAEAEYYERERQKEKEGNHYL